MSSYYEWIRAAHIIAVIFWMAGLLYLPRLFVYHFQAKLGGELDETLKLQEKRLLKIIMTPAMAASLIFGILLIIIRLDALTGQAWLHVKLLGVFILFGFHGLLSADTKKFARGEKPRSEKTYRLMNEVPAILTIIIVIMAVIEPF